MPIGYIMMLVILGILTALALLRIRRFGHVLFAAALPASELPHLGRLFLGLSTLVAWRQDNLVGTPGIICLMTAGLILIGLIVLLYRAIRARSVIH